MVDSSSNAAVDPQAGAPDLVADREREGQRRAVGTAHRFHVERARIEIEWTAGQRVAETKNGRTHQPAGLEVRAESELDRMGNALGRVGPGVRVAR